MNRAKEWPRIMDKLAAMEAFIRVVEAGSFTAVARELGSTQSAVSKQVAALEAHLGVQLLSRTTRSTVSTDEGRAYYEQVQRIVADVREAESSLRKGTRAVQGRLRIGASAGFGRFVLFPIIQAFMKKYPSIEVDLQLSDSFVDVVAQGLDVAVRIGELADSSLLAQRMGVTHRSVVASRQLAADLNKKRRLPQKPSDLAKHDCIIYTGLATTSTWVFDAVEGKASERVKVNGKLHTNSTEIVRAAVVGGLGIGFTPNWYFNDELKNGEIIRLLPQYSPHPLPINAIYPTSRKHSAKVAAFIQFTRQLMV
jgi:DNA-binding transcriptional LysR family regulator